MKRKREKKKEKKKTGITTVFVFAILLPAASCDAVDEERPRHARPVGQGGGGAGG